MEKYTPKSLGNGTENMKIMKSRAEAAVLRSECCDKCCATLCVSFLFKSCNTVPAQDFQSAKSAPCKCNEFKLVMTGGSLALFLQTLSFMDH